MTDIQLSGGDIALGNADFNLVEGPACVVQDFRERLLTEAGALFYDPAFGAGLKRFIHAPMDAGTQTQIKALILRAIQAEARIAPDSGTVKLRAGEVLEAAISFEVEDSPEPVNLTLRLGEELTIYEVQNG